MSQNNFKGLAYSMFTATLAGLIIAFLGIFIFDFFNHSNFLSADVKGDENIAKIPNELEGEEEDSDPTFVSRFSRVMIYSNEDNREIIESAKKSLPTTGTKPVSAKGYTVMNMNINSPVLEKNIDTLYPIASITKLVTAIISRKLMDQNESITITKEMLDTYGNEGRLRIGEKIKIKELMYPLLLVSSNDAGEAIARSYIAGRSKFIKEMNSWVNEIGAYRTYFKDPTGLSAFNVSTPHDLAIITKWILDNDPEIFDITLNKSKTIRTHTWINPTHFLNLTAYAGGKNGYTVEANRTSVSLFKLGKQKRLFAVILLGSGSRDNDILDLLDEAVK